MRRLLRVAVGGVAGCGGWFPVAPPPPVEAAWTTHHGAGWSVVAPADGRVAASADGLSVDAADGAYWFDVRWVDHPGAAVPVAYATAWGEERCRPLRWDQPATPVDGVWTAGGFCTIDGRRYWALAAVETREPGRSLLTGLIASRDRMTYEDLWVVFTGAALSVTDGADAVPLASPDALRDTLRTVRATSPEGDKPVPGGGVFSTAVSQTLAGAWAARQQRPLPGAFTP